MRWTKDGARVVWLSLLGLALALGCGDDGAEPVDPASLDARVPTGPDASAEAGPPDTGPPPPRSCGDGGAACDAGATSPPGHVSGVIYAESFERGPAGWRAGDVRASWAHGKPDKAFIPQAADGERAWVTGLRAPYLPDALGYLVSPAFDFSAQTEDPMLTFALLYDLEAGHDHVRAEISFDDGESYEPLGGVGSGHRWYDDELGWTGFSGEGGRWKRATQRLDGAAGERAVRLRFVMTSDESAEHGGFGLDDVKIHGEFADVALGALELQTTRCVGATSPPIARVTNLGTGTAEALILTLEIDGERAAQIEVPALAPGETRDVEIAADAADALAPGPHAVAAQLALAGDAIAENDGAQAEFLVLARAEAAGYAEGFEDGAGGWQVTGSHPSWALGTPAGEVIAGAGQGEQAFVTNLEGEYDDDQLSYLLSPCFDLSEAEHDPTVRFLEQHDLEPGVDHAWVEWSADGGLEWQKLGTVGSGIAWYDALRENAWSGRSLPDGQWRLARHVLPGAAGAAQVALRFVLQSDASLGGEGMGIDDVRFAETAVDVAAGAVTLPSAGCAGRTDELLLAEISNRGDRELSQFTLTFEVDGQPLREELIAEPIPPHRTYRHPFQLGAAITAEGAHTIVVRAQAAGDEDPTNDSTHVLTHSQPVLSGLDYHQDFESDDGRFVSIGKNSSWAHGTPAGEFVSGGAGASEYAWCTALDGTYAGGEESWLVSPCFDLSDTTIDPQLELQLAYHIGVNDYAWVEISTDAGASFRHLGRVGSGRGWYNTLPDAERHRPNHYWVGRSGEPESWIPAAHQLVGAAGRARVLFRIGFKSWASTTPPLADGIAIDDVAIVR